MILLNFSHPITSSQLTQLHDILQEELVVRDVPTQIDNQATLLTQVQGLVQACKLSSTEWQSEAILVNPPGYAPVVAILMAELHGRMGHFPTLLRLRPVANSTPTRYEVAELINLQAVREASRRER